MKQDNCIQSKTFCSLAWTHIQVSSHGKMKPCCRFKDKTYKDRYEVDVVKYLNSNFVKNIRRNMIDGERIPGCRKCYEEELSGKKSYRQQSNELYPVDLDNPKIQYLELSFGNRCNFACLSCNIYSSSGWYDDTMTLYDEGFSVRRNSLQKDIELDIDLSQIDLSELKTVKLLGGEPFFDQNNISIMEDLRRQNRLTDISFTTHTNCSFIPNKKWVEFFHEIKTPIIKISLDGIEEYAEYIRYGTKWERTLRTLNFWKQLSHETNINVGFHCVVSIYNVFHLKKIYDWFITNINDFYVWGVDANQKDYIDDILYKRIRFDVLVEPQYLNISILPDKYKKRIESELSDIPMFKQVLERLYYGSTNRDMLLRLKRYTKIMESKRGNSIADIDSNLKELLDNDI